LSVLALLRIRAEIGFGSQRITGNFISSIIILFESHIKVGDWIKVGYTSCDVMKISTHAKIILTNDNIAITIL
jgi:potassium efflux system protein